MLLSIARRNFSSECWVRHLSMGISECHKKSFLFSNFSRIIVFFFSQDCDFLVLGSWSV